LDPTFSISITTDKPSKSPPTTTNCLNLACKFIMSSLTKKQSRCFTIHATPTLILSEDGLIFIGSISRIPCSSNFINIYIWLVVFHRCWNPYFLTMKREIQVPSLNKKLFFYNLLWKKGFPKFYSIHIWTIYIYILNLLIHLNGKHNHSKIRMCSPRILVFQPFSSPTH